jgi:two-component system, NarL family, nitrate/nitrite response regulator NarL
MTHPNPSSLAGRPLTPRELQVLAGAANGQPNAEIGASMFIATDTVKTHIQRILGKLGARDRTHAVALVLASGELRSSDVQQVRAERDAA